MRNKTPQSKEEDQESNTQEKIILEIKTFFDLKGLGLK